MFVWLAHEVSKFIFVILKEFPAFYVPKAATFHRQRQRRPRNSSRRSAQEAGIDIALNFIQALLSNSGNSQSSEEVNDSKVSVVSAEDSNTVQAEDSNTVQAEDSNTVQAEDSNTVQADRDNVKTDGDCVQMKNKDYVSDSSATLEHDTSNSERIGAEYLNLLTVDVSFRNAPDGHLAGTFLMANG